MNQSSWLAAIRVFNVFGFIICLTLTIFSLMSAGTISAIVIQGVATALFGLFIANDIKHFLY